MKKVWDHHTTLQFVIENASRHERIEEKFVDVHACHHISFNDGDP